MIINRQSYRPQVFDEVESLFQPDEGSSDENWNDLKDPAPLLHLPYG